MQQGQHNNLLGQNGSSFRLHKELLLASCPIFTLSVQATAALSGHRRTVQCAMKYKTYFRSFIKHVQVT